MFYQVFYFFPILELLTYVVFTHIFGIGAALLYGMVSFILGLSLLRGRGLAMFAQEVRSRNISSMKAFNLSMFAGILLIIPGFITDTIGFLLLIPAIFQLVTSKASSSTHRSQADVPPEETIHTGNVVDGEYTVVDEDKKK